MTAWPLSPVELANTLPPALMAILLFWLAPIRTWLRIRRETAARGRTFKYRKFLTPEQLKRRTRCLSNWAEEHRALAWIPDIGGIFNENETRGYGRLIAMSYMERPQRIFASSTVWREDFTLLPVRDSSGFRATILLIDEEDSTGARMLCEQLDRRLACERFRLASCTPWV